MPARLDSSAPRRAQDQPEIRHLRIAPQPLQAEAFQSCGCAHRRPCGGIWSCHLKPMGKRDRNAAHPEGACARSDILWGPAFGPGCCGRVTKDNLVAIALWAAFA